MQITKCILGAVLLATSQVSAAPVKLRGNQIQLSTGVYSGSAGPISLEIDVNSTTGTLDFASSNLGIDCANVPYVFDSTTGDLSLPSRAIDGSCLSAA